MSKVKLTTQYLFSYEYSISERSSVKSNTYYTDPVDAWNASRGVGWYGSNGYVHPVGFITNKKTGTIKLEWSNQSYEYHKEFNCWTKTFDYTTNYAVVSDICKRLNVTTDTEFLYTEKGVTYLVNPRTSSYKLVCNLSLMYRSGIKEEE